MSELKHILKIEPDEHGTRTETRYASGFPCPRCSGQGGFRDGTGKVRATITVEWEADYES